MQKISKYFVPLCVIVIAVFIIGGLLWLALQKPSIEYDEAFTLLAATGHEGEIQRIIATQSSPIGEVSSGRYWKRFIQPEDKFVFSRIASDLSASDAHPPLFFWILHLWALAFGASAFSAVSINILNVVLIAIALFLIGKQFFPLKIVYLIVLLWLLSPTTIHTTVFIRHYLFFALLSLLYAYFTYSTFYVPEHYQLKWKDSLVWVVMATLMMLSHAFALFFLGAGFITVFMKSIFQNWRRIPVFVGHLIVSVMLCLLIYPGYIRQFARGRSMSSPLTWEAFTRRFDEVIQLSVSFILDKPYHNGIYSWVKPMLIVGVIVAIVLPLIIQLYRMQQPRLKAIYTNTTVQNAFFWIVFFLVAYLSMSALYVLGLTPISYRYYIQAIVFAVFIPAFLLQLPILNRLQSVIIIVVIATMLVTASLTIKQISESFANLGNPSRYPQGNEFIMVSISARDRGHLSQVAYNLPDDALVYVQLRDKIADDSSIWLEQMQAAEVTLLLGAPNNNLFEAIENADYVIQPFASYLHYTDTKRVTR